jgi:hypothetical protein
LNSALGEIYDRPPACSRQAYDERKVPMRRTFSGACVAILVAGLVVAPATAKTKRFTGTVTGGGEVTFVVQFKQGKPKRAGLFAFTHIPVSCDEGDTTVSFSTQNDVRVINREFHYRFNFSSGTARIDGKLKRSLTKATGTMRYGPADPSSAHTDCRTGGLRDWRAFR